MGKLVNGSPALENLFPLTKTSPQISKKFPPVSVFDLPSQGEETLPQNQDPLQLQNQDPLQIQIGPPRGIGESPHQSQNLRVSFATVKRLVKLAQADDILKIHCVSTNLLKMVLLKDEFQVILEAFGVKKSSSPKSDLCHLLKCTNFDGRREHTLEVEPIPTLGKNPGKIVISRDILESLRELKVSVRLTSRKSKISHFSIVELMILQESILDMSAIFFPTKWGANSSVEDFFSKCVSSSLGQPPTKWKGTIFHLLLLITDGKKRFFQKNSLHQDSSSLSFSPQFSQFPSLPISPLSQCEQSQIDVPQDVVSEKSTEKSLEALPSNQKRKVAKNRVSDPVSDPKVCGRGHVIPQIDSVIHRMFDDLEKEEKNLPIVSKPIVPNSVLSNPVQLQKAQKSLSSEEFSQLLEFRESFEDVKNRLAKLKAKQQEIKNQDAEKPVKKKRGRKRKAAKKSQTPTKRIKK